MDGIIWDDKNDDDKDDDDDAVPEFIKEHDDADDAIVERGNIPASPFMVYIAIFDWAENVLVSQSSAFLFFTPKVHHWGLTTTTLWDILCSF